MVNKKIKIILTVLIWTFSILATLLVNLYPVNAAVDIDYVFKINQNADIKVACFDVDNTLCTNSTDCYITVNNPSGNNIVKGETMAFNDDYYSYNIPGYKLNIEGEYSTVVNCEGTFNGYTAFLFEITSSGKRQENSAVVIFGIVILAFLFLAVGMASDNILFKIVSAIIFVIDGLVLITTGVGGIDTVFTIGIGIILAVIGGFIAIVSWKGD